MTPGFTFLAGISLLALFGWYFATSRARLKRILGTMLTVLLVAFCLTTLYPPDKTIRLGLDLQGGTSFLIRLTPEGERSISADTLDQAVEVIRKRVMNSASANQLSHHKAPTGFLCRSPDSVRNRLRWRGSNWRR
jgi:SecD/SecF fusion protein